MNFQFINHKGSIIDEELDWKGIAFVGMFITISGSTYEVEKIEVWEGEIKIYVTFQHKG